MTQDEFVAKYRHEIDGWILDAAMEGRRGAELSIWLKTMRSKIESKLRAMYVSMQPDTAPSNGVVTKGVKR
jgi:hypothetical protein